MQVTKQVKMINGIMYRKVRTETDPVINHCKSYVTEASVKRLERNCAKQSALSILRDGEWEKPFKGFKVWPKREEKVIPCRNLTGKAMFNAVNKLRGV